jgi:peptidoglycan/LPS O-acetylase OafA/YrhL
MIQGAKAPLEAIRLLPSQETGNIAVCSRVAAIDGLRGILALVVVGWHIGARFHFEALVIPADIAVAIFFVLSGYVLTRTWDGRFGLFLLRRFVRLWPVYAVCLAAGYYVAGVRPLWTEFFWFPYIDPNANPAIDPPVWSLFLEAWAMPFMPVIVWCGSGGPRRAGAAMVGALVGELVDVRIAVGALFIFGAFVARTQFRNRLLETPVAQLLGRISYSLYLTHWIVLELAVRACGPWGSVVFLPIAVAVAWLVWRLVEQPSIWLSRYVGTLAGRERPSLKGRIRN